MLEKGDSLKNKPLLLWGSILTITLFWGYAWVLMKASLAYMGPFAFSTFRFTTGTLTLFFLLWMLKIRLPKRKDLPHFVIVGLLQTTLVFLPVMYGLLFLGAGKASVLLYSMPLWSGLLAVKYLGEKMTVAKMAGLSAGMFGLLVIIGSDLWFGHDGRAVIGELFILIGSLSWAVSNIYYRKKLEHLPKLQLSAFQMFFGTIGIFVAYLLTEWKESVHWTGESIYYVLFTGVVASALCFTVWFVIISSVDMVTATISTLLVPVFGLIFSHFLLGEKITVEITIGSAFIIAGIIVSQMKERLFGKNFQA